MTQEGARITPRQRRLIELLLQGLTISEACKQAKVGRRTYYRWREQDHFRRALTEAENETISGSMRSLLSMMRRATEALEQLLSDPTLRPADRLRTAQTILDGVLRLRNAIDVEVRLAELEAKVAQLAPPDTEQTT